MSSCINKGAAVSLTLTFLLRNSSNKTNNQVLDSANVFGQLVGVSRQKFCIGCLSAKDAIREKLDGEYSLCMDSARMPRKETRRKPAKCNPNFGNNDGNYIGSY